MFTGFMWEIIYLTLSSRIEKPKLNASEETDVGQIQNNLQGNNCNSSPCSNGASCVNLYNDYYCDCLGGFTGRGKVLAKNRTYNVSQNI